MVLVFGDAEALADPLLKFGVIVNGDCGSNYAVKSCGVKAVPHVHAVTTSTPSVASPDDVGLRIASDHAFGSGDRAVRKHRVELGKDRAIGGVNLVKENHAAVTENADNVRLVVDAVGILIAKHVRRHGVWRE